MVSTETIFVLFVAVTGGIFRCILFLGHWFWMLVY